MARRGSSPQPREFRAGRAGTLHPGGDSRAVRSTCPRYARVHASTTTLRTSARHGDALGPDRRGLDGAGAHAAGGVRILLSLATAISILAVALLLVMTPVWMHLALGATSVANFVSPQQAFDLSDKTVAELFFGPGTFAPFAADEAAHMRDVRVVLYGFLLLAAASLVFVAVSLVRTPRDVSRWKAVGRGGI